MRTDCTIRIRAFVRVRRGMEGDDIFLPLLLVIGVIVSDISKINENEVGRENR